MSTMKAGREFACHVHFQSNQLKPTLWINKREKVAGTPSAMVLKSSSIIKAH